MTTTTTDFDTAPAVPAGPSWATRQATAWHAARDDGALESWHEHHVGTAGSTGAGGASVTLVEGVTYRAGGAVEHLQAEVVLCDLHSSIVVAAPNVRALAALLLDAANTIEAAK